MTRYKGLVNRSWVTVLALSNGAVNEAEVRPKSDWKHISLCGKGSVCSSHIVSQFAENNHGKVVCDLLHVQLYVPLDSVFERTQECVEMFGQNDFPEGLKIGIARESVMSCHSLRFPFVTVDEDDAC